MKTVMMLAVTIPGDAMETESDQAAILDAIRDAVPGARVEVEDVQEER